MKNQWRSLLLWHASMSFFMQNGKNGSAAWWPKALIIAKIENWIVFCGRWSKIVKNAVTVGFRFYLQEFVIVLYWFVSNQTNSCWFHDIAPSIAYFSLSINGRGKLIVLLLSICHLQEAMISILCKMTSDAGLWGGAETAEQRFFCSKRRRRTHLFFVLKLF